MANNAALTALALIEGVLNEDGQALSDINAVVSAEDWPRVAGCLATLMATGLEEGLTKAGALAQIEQWQVKFMGMPS